jgi:hypothetical protein
VHAARPGARSRAVRTALVATGLALLAHVAAGGRVDAAALTMGLVAVVALAGFAALRRPGAVSTVVGLAGLQFAVHLTAASTSAAPGADHLTFLCGAHSGSGRVTTAHLVAMIATHVSATLLSAWWLLRADAAAVALVSRARSALTAFLVPPAIPIPARERAMVEEARRHCQARSGSVAGRAPPLGSWF